MTGGFFQIDANAWSRVVHAGLNASVVYLVLACGTGRDNRTTNWSVNAVEKYTGIGRTMAKRAIDALLELGVISRREGTRPAYRIEPLAPVNRAQCGIETEGREPDWIWLPNALVTGAADEVPPVERVRRLQNVKVLELLIALYDIQDLAENGGIWWCYIRAHYERAEITQRGIWNIWGFKRLQDTTWLGSPVLAPFEKMCSADSKREQVTKPFWESWNALRRLGLIECVPHLVEGDNDEAALIYPCPAQGNDGTAGEHELGALARNCARKMLGQWMEHWIDAYDIVVPVPDSYPAVELVGVFRLRYRPHTRKTAAWFAKSKSDDWRARFIEAAGD